MRQTRFFSPAELERTTVLSRALDLSLSLSADFIATFFFVPRRRGLVVFFFGCILSSSFFLLRCCVFSNVFCGQTQARCSASQFQTKWKERDLVERIIVVASRRALQTKETFNKNGGFLSLRSFSRSLFDKARRRRRRRHRFETTPLCVVKAKKKALTKTLDVPLLLRTTNPLYIG